MSRHSRAHGNNRGRRGPEQQDVTNPYTFLPYARTPPPGRHSPASSHTFPPKEGDGLRAADPGSLRSGRIHVRLDVRTPLALHGESWKEPAEKKWTDSTQSYEPVPKGQRKQDHTVVKLPRDGQGRPLLFGSGVKGAMRSWYEAITSSPRLANPVSVAWRTTSLGEVRPGVLRVRRNGEPSKTLDASARSLRDFERELGRGLRLEIEPMSEAPPRDQRDHRERNRELVNRIAQLDSTLEDGQRVTLQNGTQAPETWRLKVSAGVGRQPLEASVQVFFPPAGEPPDPIPVERDAVLDWYVAHQGGGAPSGRRRARLPGTDWEGMVSPLDARVLFDGVLVWYSCDTSGRVDYFGRLRHGRWASRDPLPNRIPQGHRAPPPPLLSPAERVFGSTGEAREGLESRHERDATAPEAVAWAGRVRPRLSRWSGADPASATESVRLGVLSSPKLQSAGLYLEHPRGDATSWSPTDTMSSLRGTKVYWHHPDAAPKGRELDLSTDLPKTGQNSTVEVVKDGAFEVEIVFEDLTEAELGALLLACSLRFTDEEAERGWKLGTGKPLGLGSVANTLGPVVLHEGWSAIDDPFSPDSGERLLSQDVVRGLEQAALEEYLPHVADRAVLAGIAELAGLDRAQATRPVRYPERGAIRRTPDGRSPHQPTAAEVLGVQR